MLIRNVLFQKWCQIYRLVGKVHLVKRQGQKFLVLSFVFDVDYMERKEYAWFQRQRMFGNPIDVSVPWNTNEMEQVDWP